MKKLAVVSLGVVMSLGLSACASNGTISKRDVGLVAGGVVGGVAGNALFGSTLGTVGGAVGGAYLGSIVGQSMEKK